MDSTERLLKVSEVCKRLSLSAVTVRRLVKRGELRPAIYGKRFLFPESEVQDWIKTRLAARTQPPQGATW